MPDYYAYLSARHDLPSPRALSHAFILSCKIVRGFACSSDEVTPSAFNISTWAWLSRPSFKVKCLSSCSITMLEVQSGTTAGSWKHFGPCDSNWLTSLSCRLRTSVLFVQILPVIRQRFVLRLQWKIKYGRDCRPIGTNGHSKSRHHSKAGSEKHVVCIIMYWTEMFQRKCAMREPYLRPRRQDIGLEKT